MVVSSSKESSSSGRTISDVEASGTIAVDMSVVHSGEDEGLHVGIETGQSFRYPENVDVAKKFLQYKKGLDGKWGNYVMNAGLWFRALVRPGGKIEHYQVPSLDHWKRNMGIGDDIDISYYNGIGAEGVMNALKSFPGQLNSNVFEMMRVCEALNKRLRDGGIARQFVADDVLKYYKFKYMKDRKNGYLFSDSARPKFFDLESARRPWCDHLMMVSGNCMQVPEEPALKLIYKNFNEKPNPKGVADTSSLFDIVSREGNELNKVLGELDIRRDKRMNSIVGKVQITHQNRAMATSSSAFDDITEIPAGAASTSISKIDNLKEKRQLPLSEKIYLVQTTRVKTEVVDAAINVVPPLKKQKQESGKDSRASSKGLSVAWQSAVKVLKAFYFWRLRKDDVNLAITGKYGEIIFPEEDPSLVADRPSEQTPDPPVADDTTKEEVVHLRGKVSEMEKALSRVRDSINRTRQGKRMMRILFFDIKKEDRRVQAQLENDLKHAYDELERCKDHNAYLEREKVECNKLLQSLEKRVKLLEVHLLDTQKCLQVSQSRLKRYLMPKRGKCSGKADHERQMADAIEFYGGELARVEKEFRHYILSCGKDVEVENDKVENMWFAKGKEGGGASTSTPRAGESEEEEVEDLLPHKQHKTPHQEAEVNEQNELSALSASNNELTVELQQCPLAVENTTLLNSKLEADMLELQSRLNTVTEEFSCKDAEIMTAKNKAEL
ncbi:hypothetical protein GIB67_008240 [Kingdonia uniflora]|uniref:Uncharacterized protein n=1 Tax=Kingdonia uniflora TaxID=39325 RepID=A0A7J7N4I1_9MAGN|nr:hypothetical protein GIB67_008240 [Kingdonia uniflora]